MGQTVGQETVATSTFAHWCGKPAWIPVRSPIYTLSMSDKGDIHETAASYYLVKIVNGAVPEIWVNQDGNTIRYFPLTLDDVDYWLTEEGLFTPPDISE